MLTIKLPPDEIPTDSIPSELRKVFPHWDEWRESFRNGSTGMRKILEELRRGRSYDITVSRTLAEAREQIQRNTFDIAIVDIRWEAEDKLPAHERDSAGWSISDEIEEVDENKGRKTLQIICSSRFDTEPALTLEVVRRKKFPVLKIYNEQGGRALKLAIDYLEEAVLKGQRTPGQFFQEMMDQLQSSLVRATENMRQIQNKWIKVAIPVTIIAVLVLFAGIILAAVGYIQVDTIHTISTILTAALCALLYKQLRNSQKTAEKSISSLQSALNNSSKHFVEYLKNLTGGSRVTR